MTLIFEVIHREEIVIKESFDEKEFRRYIQANLLKKVSTWYIQN